MGWEEDGVIGGPEGGCRKGVSRLKEKVNQIDKYQTNHFPNVIFFLKYKEIIHKSSKVVIANKPIRRKELKVSSQRLKITELKEKNQNLISKIALKKTIL